MEATTRQLQRVDVLRHSFTPSELLAIDVENFMRPGITRPRFLYATRTVVVDYSKHSIVEANIDIDAAAMSFRKEGSKKIQLGAWNPQEEDPRQRSYLRMVMLGAKATGSQGLRIGLMPQDEIAFKEMIAPFDKIPNDSPKAVQSAMKRQFLYVDIPAHALIEQDEISSAARSLQRHLSDASMNALYTARPNGIERSVL
jgi:hypothetical protein